MRAAPAFLDRVSYGKLEHHLAAVDFPDLHVDGYLQAEGRGGEVVDGDMGADRVLAGVEVADQPVAARVLDVAHHLRRGVDHAFLAHEGDAAAFIDEDFLGEGKPAPQGSLHGALKPARSTAFFIAPRSTCAVS